MATLLALSLSLLLALHADYTQSVETRFKSPINNTLEPGVQTECKTCPYSLCTNKVFYEYETNVTLVCCTSGTEIGGDMTWLRTTDGCYVTQYDLMDYNGTCELLHPSVIVPELKSVIRDEDDLSFCGKASEEKNITYDTATVKYDSECNICPDNASCETTQYLKPKSEIRVTCWTADGAFVIDDSTWLKTTDNCYVAEIGLEHKGNRDVLDNCGPIGFLQVNYTDTGTESTQPIETSPVLRNTPQSTPPPVSVPSSTINNDLHKRYLINITVGEDFALCHASPSSSSQIEKRYDFGQEVWMQCYVDAAAGDVNQDSWYETIDFCYVREGDFWESLYDQYRFPSCDLFV